MAIQILKNTHQEAVIKVWGAAAVSETIDISTLLAVGQALDGATQAATITGVTWSGAPDGVVTISRSTATIMTLQANAAGMLYFEGQTMPPDSVQQNADIVVAISGAACECWLKIRKTSGYRTMIEDATYGAYDDPTRVGASTTQSGSPDKV